MPLGSMWSDPVLGIDYFVIGPSMGGQVPVICQTPFGRWRDAMPRELFGTELVRVTGD